MEYKQLQTSQTIDDRGLDAEDNLMQHKDNLMQHNSGSDDIQSRSLDSSAAPVRSVVN